MAKWRRGGGGRRRGRWVIEYVPKVNPEEERSMVNGQLSTVNEGEKWAAAFLQSDVYADLTPEERQAVTEAVLTSLVSDTSEEIQAALARVNSRLRGLRSEVRHDGEAGAVPERGGTGCGDGLAAPAGVEPCAAQLLEADAAAEGEETGEEGNAIADG